MNHPPRHVWQFLLQKYKPLSTHQQSCFVLWWFRRNCLIGTSRGNFCPLLRVTVEWEIEWRNKEQGARTTTHANAIHARMRGRQPPSHHHHHRPWRPFIWAFKKEALYRFLILRIRQSEFRILYIFHYLEPGGRKWFFALPAKGADQIWKTRHSRILKSGFDTDPKEPSHFSLSLFEYFFH